MEPPMSQNFRRLILHTAALLASQYEGLPQQTELLKAIEAATRENDELLQPPAGTTD